MLVYLDTSALVPIVIHEEASDLCRRLWREADSVASSVLIHPEATAALARACRMGRITQEQLHAVVDRVEDLVMQVSRVRVTDQVAAEAARVAVAHGLRGYDAVHVATARLVISPETLVASGDAEMLAVCRELGMATISTVQR